MAGSAPGRKLLLISNSVCHDKPYLGHCAAAIRQFLGGATKITFVPYAARDWNGYAHQVRGDSGEPARRASSIPAVRRARRRHSGILNPPPADTRRARAAAVRCVSRRRARPPVTHRAISRAGPTRAGRGAATPVKRARIAEKQLGLDTLPRGRRRRAGSGSRASSES